MIYDNSIITFEMVVEITEKLKSIKPEETAYEKAQYFLKVEATNYNLSQARDFIISYERNRV